MKRTAAFDTAMREILGGRFANLDLAALRPQMPEAEFSELSSLFEFETGRLRPARKVAVWEQTLWLWVLRSRLFTYFCVWLLAIVRRSAALVGRDTELFDRLYTAWMPDLIHYRYTCFSRGLLYSFVLFRLSPVKTRPEARAYAQGLYGHFLCLCGRFDRGLPQLRRADGKLQKLQREQNADGPRSPLLYHFYYINLGILSFQLGYGGRMKESNALYERLFQELERAPYFWEETFARSLRMFNSLELLDSELLSEDARQLKAILGEKYLGKYSLRTATYSALLAAIRKDFVSAKEQILASEEHYSQTTIAVELARFHFLRALADLELGNVPGALQHSRSAVSFGQTISGARFHQADMELLELEIALRALLIRPDPLVLRQQRRDIARRLRRIGRRIQGSHLIDARVKALQILLWFLDGKYRKAAAQGHLFRERIVGASQRVAMVFSQFDSGAASPQNVPSSADLTETRIDASIIDKIVQLIGEPDLEAASRRVLKSLFQASEVRTSSVKGSRGAGELAQYAMSQTEQGEQRLELFLPTETLRFDVVAPLNNIHFDRRLKKTVELALNVIHAGFLRRASIKAEREAALVSLAQQVAHDLCSPLSALTIATSDVSALSESQRTLIRAATARIKDIVNLLSEKNKSGAIGSAQRAPKRQTEFLPSLVDAIVSEKRVEYRALTQVSIDLFLDENSYGLFSSVDASAFKSVISNLVNNAVEAMDGGPGNVQVRFADSAQQVVIQVRDNGKGISADILARLGERGFSYGKEQGSGLGLFDARQKVESWDGRLEVESSPGVGTTVTLFLPKVAAPGWFVPQLAFASGTRVAVVDDDPSIHEVWGTRLKGVVTASRLELKDFFVTDELRRWCKARTDLENTTFLVDYEFNGERTNGLDIIEELQIADSAFLVTSHFEDPHVLARCKRLGVGLIPKGMAGYIPVRVMH